MPFIRVRHDGAITIPFELRRKYSITPGAWYQISISSKGRLLLSPQQCKCSLCGEPVASIDTVTGTCKSCKDELTNLVRGGMSLSGALKYVQCRRKNGSI